MAEILTLQEEFAKAKERHAAAYRRLDMLRKDVAQADIEFEAATKALAKAQEQMLLRGLPVT